MDENTNKTQFKERYVVVGFGWVGQANALAMKMSGLEVAYFDPGEPKHHYGKFQKQYESLHRLRNVLDKDSERTWYVVCVGDRVSDEGVQDITYIKNALESLKGAKGGVILRSTILPDLLEDLSFDFYVPEFLHEKKAVEEVLHPYMFVFGRKSLRPEPKLFSVWKNRAHKIFEGTPREASFIKYLSNLWNSVRIAFVNEFGNAIGHPHKKEDLAQIDNVINFLFDGRSYLRYGKSFGGHCLPKDTRAFKNWYGQKAKLPLLDGTYASNDVQLALEKEFPLMPEWYSEWPDRHIGGVRAAKELWYSFVKNTGLRKVLPRAMW